MILNLVLIFMESGVPSHLIRVSVGVEDILHLKHVFKDALDQCPPEDD